MMTSTKNPSKPLRDVLYDFSIAQEVPDADLLDEYVKLYPSYATELTEFAINMFVDAMRGTEEATQAFEEESVSPAVSRAMSAFQVALQESHAQQQMPSTDILHESVSVDNPFTKFDRKEFRALSKSLNMSTVFLGKIRDCMIDPQTIPEGFFLFLSDKLMISEEKLKAFLGRNTPQLAGQYFKAEKKPSVVDQQSFRDAVKGSKLTDEQQQFFLEL